MPEIRLKKSDPFESVLFEMVEMNRRKRADYAGEDNIFGNFDFNAEMSWLEDHDAFHDCYTMVTRKIGRIRNLMEKGVEPQNESLEDSLVDLAVYAVLLIGISRRDALHNGHDE